ncbi:MAG TPA: CCA tRNA nucleotidyltransferase [Tepidisphaeraceae bacterium]|nr:CCA tRNA nucleotidyltransferase [Tepidisphaeraceae bacterium]
MADAPAPEIRTKPPCSRQDAAAVVARLRGSGHVAYFAGGCVRDALLGLEPKDYDVATDAPPKRVRQLFPQTQAVGAAFGVILVRHGPSTIEVATFRTEGTYTDGRRPDSVRFTTAAEDAQRRDFTINGLFLDPAEGSGLRVQGSESTAHATTHLDPTRLGHFSDRVPRPEDNEPTGGESPCPILSSDLGETVVSGAPLPPTTPAPRPPISSPPPLLHPTPHGTILDYVGGVADLRASLLRAIGDPRARFAEDHLRLLRAVRFAARFGLSIDPATAAAIRDNATKLRGISPERIAEELRLMLTPPTRAAAWPALWEFALIDVIMRFVPGAPGVDVEAADLDPARSFFLRVAPDEPISFGLALAAAVLDYRLQSLPDTGPALEARLLAMLSRADVQRMGRAVREALRVSNEELDEMLHTLEPLATLLAPDPLRVATCKRFLARPTAPQTLRLITAIADLGWFAPTIARLRDQLDPIIQSDETPAPTPLITGDDLKHLGLKPGPLYKRLLDDVYDAQLEARVTTRNQALDLATQLAQPRP